MSEPYQPKAKNKKVYFPKKSHHGYFDTTFQRHFYDEKQKREFMNSKGFMEAPSASKAHMKRVKDFSAWIKNERIKNPKFTPKGERYQSLSVFLSILLLNEKYLQHSKDKAD